MAPADSARPSAGVGSILEAQRPREAVGVAIREVVFLIVRVPLNPESIHFRFGDGRG
jgi:hypothetical protein